MNMLSIMLPALLYMIHTPSNSQINWEFAMREEKPCMQSMLGIWLSYPNVVRPFQTIGYAKSKLLMETQL